MKGFIVQVNQDFVNNQNLLIESIDYALLFKTQVDADLVAQSHKRQGVSVAVLPHENNLVAGIVQSGSYFEYHTNF